MTRISKILVANRGEIAVRVFRTCQKLGISTVAVYSDPDKDSPHVAMADEAVYIGQAAASESYLKTDVIIDAAKRTGADAIHPGYGFLSENPSFAQACAKAGITFIGPLPDTMHLLGNKKEVKDLLTAKYRNVPLIPGYNGDDQSIPALKAKALEIGESAFSVCVLPA